MPTWDLQSLTEVVLDYFVPLRAKFGWGESLTYQIAARGQVHLHVQTLEQEIGLKEGEVASIIGRLSGCMLQALVKRFSRKPSYERRALTSLQMKFLILVIHLFCYSGQVGIEQHKSALKRYLQKAR